MRFHGAFTTAHRSGCVFHVQSFERTQHKCLSLPPGQRCYRKFEALHRLGRLQVFIRRSACRIRRTRNRIGVVRIALRSTEPDHYAIANSLSAMPVPNSILQNSVKERRPFSVRPIRPLADSSRQQARLPPATQQLFAEFMRLRGGVQFLTKIWRRPFMLMLGPCAHWGGRQSTLLNYRVHLDCPWLR